MPRLFFCKPAASLFGDPSGNDMFPEVVGMRKFRLEIVGGTDREAAEGCHRHPTAEDVRREARRRLAIAGHDTARVRAIAMGRELPASSRYLGMQIEFVAQSLAALRPIPPDFASDRYWPAFPPRQR